VANSQMMARSFKFWVLATAATAVAGASAVMVLGRVAPSLPASDLAAKVFPIAEPAAFRADVALRRQDWAAVRRWSLREIQVSPVRQDAWLRLADADIGAHGRLTIAGTDALRHAYDAAPYDLDPLHRRRALVQHHLAELNAALRDDVEIERRAELQGR